jgi:murein DD-endopeptidase MepM/ murein hydrolase activator NlpD
MSANRPILTSLLAAALVAVSCAAAASAAATKVPRLVFPVVGKVSFTDDFGDPRWEGGHPGNDILADRGAPVVAVEAGRIVFWTKSASAGCMLYLYGKSGTTYQYIHLNNDLTAKNDNRGSCVAGVSYAPNLRDGQDVKVGELIGFVGDSGDANGIHPHLHFEVHPGGGQAVSPYRWLRRATRPAAIELQLVTAPPVRPRPAE